MKKPILELKPTQFALGLHEVQRKLSKMKDMGRDERREYLRARPVPVVISPQQHWRLVDHHHHVRACWELGVEELPVELKADFSHLSADEFWEVMHKSHWVHLHDQFGSGPHPPHLLPGDVRGMADDPYRSLAWALRQAGAYEKTDEPYAEFKWADFLRGKIVIDADENGFSAALKAALALARGPEAAHLPGHRPKP